MAGKAIHNRAVLGALVHKRHCTGKNGPVAADFLKFEAGTLIDEKIKGGVALTGDEKPQRDRPHRGRHQ
jgi:hypothetical protein